MDVRKVYTTVEVANKLDISPQHCLKIAKELYCDGKLSDFEFRDSGKRTYLFNDSAIKKLENYFKNKKR
ncbi:hypothetical protein GMA43_13775 [Turicibacter sanguinis]|uniref:hypothetical protein n=1 Tax=Turicibacter TaxID=191303 RepID=UPI0012B6F5E4|nr:MULTISPECIES: hypothetical protein [unclassified Turicibacter]MTH08338.1 hypothetical protein [Turicibacter sanguinis]MCU7192782.1 hypothetical protein [Turicibacter sp. T129]MCU7208200.1 hypothetical protein [Turicibacter sp. GALT-G1]MTH11135.1 hypothetical protein [Turicibacter sanguinis]MTH13895.1 hypothetical protein [Turicibacter sanguinis]